MAKLKGNSPAGPKLASASLRSFDSDQTEDTSHYKWIALSNTTIGMLMATINSSIILISMPAIFNGVGINPLAPGETNYFLWLLLSYMVVTATLVVAFGRISDMLGRVKLYNLGFAIFTLGSILLFLTPGSGNTAVLLMIVFRVVQGVGAAFLFSNSTAILTDAFPARQRGMAMGINQIAAIVGSFVGLILGGVLAAVNWRLVFLVSVPIGIFGTVWAYLMLHETAKVRRNQKMDWPGAVTFAAGLTVLLLGITYGIEPYGTSSTGWGNPGVIAALVGGVLLLGIFVLIELRTSDPMFRLSLFRIRAFAAGNISNFLAALTRGGLQFMLVIWLQGIWLPLHGYSFKETPLWAGIYMTPLLIGFIIMGPISGWLSDRYGIRRFAVLGLLVNAVGFVGLVSLPADFNYPSFAFWLVVLGVGQGLFAAPNTTAIMNSVPPDQRGVSSGMRATFMNAASLMSIGIFFSIVTEGLASALPSSLFRGLTGAGLPAQAATAVSHLPPTAALFAAFLGYNPLATLLPHVVLAQLPVANQLSLLSKQFFPSLIAQPFIGGMRGVFIFSTVLCVIGAIVSIFCRERAADGKLETLPPVTAEEELAAPEILPALHLEGAGSERE